VKSILFLLAKAAIVVVPLFAVIYYVIGSFALALAVSIIPVIISTWMVLLPRIRMEQRAKELLAKMPQHESKTIYLSFDSALPNTKRAAMNSRISEVERDGWIFLKASEVGLDKTCSSWGGGLNLHFIRESTKSSADAS
jgi:hypothetical protein